MNVKTMKAELGRQLDSFRKQADGADHDAQKARYRNDKASEQYSAGLAYGLRTAIDQLRGLTS